jgi:sec-independent protein translocase protein TatB
MVLPGRIHETRFLKFSEESRLKGLFLFIFEGLGTSELILILVVALVIFGPRKLPQLSRSLGKSLNNFKRASEDFKQTWEKEVARESAFKEALLGESMLSEDRSILGDSRNRSQAVFEASESAQPESHANSLPAVAMDESSLARNASTTSTSATLMDEPEETSPSPIPSRKRDWL